MYLTVAQPSHTAMSISLGYIEGAEGREQSLPLKWACRHMVLTGATGTGKTETLKTIVTGFSHAGVPCFLPDVKGDLDVIARVAPTRFLDLDGEHDGQTIMVSVRDMGSTIFARMLGLSDAQKRVTTLIFALARKHRMPLNTFDDVRDVLDYIEAEENKIEIARMGHVSTATVGIIRGTLLELEEEGSGQFFGPTNFSLDQIMDTHEGQGIVSILNAKNLIHSPTAYSCFLMWLLSELSKNLPEVGDIEKPRLAFFFDECHVLFKGAATAFIDAMEITVKLIRSKGVSVNFLSQTISDIPDTILSQLTTRIQHRLSATTSKERQALRAAADAFKPNPDLGSLSDVVENLGVGEALVQVLNQKGSPLKAERVMIRRCDIPASDPVIETPRLGPVLVVDNTPAGVEVPAPELTWEALGDFQDVDPRKMARVRAYLHDVLATRDGASYGNRLRVDGEQPSIALEVTDGVGRVRLASTGRGEEFLIPVM